MWTFHAWPVSEDVQLLWHFTVLRGCPLPSHTIFKVSQWWEKSRLRAWEGSFDPASSASMTGFCMPMSASVVNCRQHQPPTRAITASKPNNTSTYYWIEQHMWKSRHQMDSLNYWGTFFFIKNKVFRVHQKHFWKHAITQPYSNKFLWLPKRFGEFETDYSGSWLKLLGGIEPIHRVGVNSVASFLVMERCSFQKEENQFMFSPSELATEASE